MSSVHSVLTKLFVARFYRLNTGFFLFFFLLLFGIADPGATLRFHYALMQGMARSPLFLLTGMAVWTLYYGKCILYCLRTVGEPQNQFLHMLQGLPRRRLQRLLVLQLMMLFLPVALYAACTFCIAVKMYRPAAPMLIIAYHLLLVAGGAGLCFSAISHTWRESALTKLLARMSWQRSGPARFSAWLLLYALHSRKVTLLVVKTISLLLLQVMIAINGERLLSEGTYFFLLVLIIVHALLPYYFVQFTEEQVWLRNMPISIAWRGAYYAGTYALLLLPELIFLLVHVHSVLSPLQMLSLYGLAVAQLCWFTAWLYLLRISMERYMLAVGVTFFITLFLLAMVNIWLMMTGLFSVSLILFPIIYNRFERKVE